MEQSDILQSGYPDFTDLLLYLHYTRGVAQPGRASALGAECHQFESGYPDKKRDPPAKPAVLHIRA